MTRKTHRRGGFGPQEAHGAPKKADSRPDRPRPREERLEKSSPRPARQPRSADVVRIYGFHACRRRSRAPRRKLVRLYATPPPPSGSPRRSPRAASRRASHRPKRSPSALPRDAVHQGVLLEARPLEPIDISELPDNGLVVVLDQITDPHNVGAILRTCAAFAVDALMTTERHSPEFSGVLAKSACGGLEHVPICSVANLARAMDELGDLGYWRVGLDSEAPAMLGATPLARPLALVLGAEDKGLRRLTRENCDVAGAARPARRDQEPQRLERLRDRAGARVRRVGERGVAARAAESAIACRKERRSLIQRRNRLA